MTDRDIQVYVWRDLPTGERCLQECKIPAMWDAEASVWVAESDDVPGLITEADSLEGLKDKLRVRMLELLDTNHAGHDRS